MRQFVAAGLRRTNQNQQEQYAPRLTLSEKVFTNSPSMLVLCLTVIGLIKIYTRFEKITTLADNFLAFISRRLF